jgi:hypothetical protein
MSALDFDLVSVTLNPAIKDVDLITQEEEVSQETDSKEEEGRAAYVAGRRRVKRRWYQWYADTDTPAERTLLIKMDLLILSYAFLGFWVKYIDNGNLTNAYVSGMKEDLGFYGNQFVQLQTVYTVAYTVFMIPLTLLAAKYRNVIPACDLMWGVLHCFSIVLSLLARWPPTGLWWVHSKASTSPRFIIHLGHGTAQMS